MVDADGRPLLHGRLHCLARVTDPIHCLPVNAVLHEIVDLFALLVVSDDAAARYVIEHFSENKIGRVTCKILAELHPSPQASTKRWSSLLDCLEIRYPRYLPLFQSLLGSWILIDTTEQAAQFRKDTRSSVCCNVVTRCVPSARHAPHNSHVVSYREGVLFKADGEISLPRKVPQLRAVCSIREEFQNPYETVFCKDDNRAMAKAKAEISELESLVSQLHVSPNR